MNPLIASPHIFKFNPPLPITIQAQRDGHKIVIQLIGPDSFTLLLHMDYAENYSHIQQIMSQQKWFKRLGQLSLHPAYPSKLIKPSVMISV